MKRRPTTLVYFGGVVAESIVRAPYDRQRRRIAKTERRVTRSEWAVLAGMVVTLGVLPVIYSATTRLDFADYRLSPRAKARLGGIGSVFLASAVWLFWRSHRDLGRNWSPSLEIGERQTLVTGGVYRAVRHPMYASQLLWGLGQVLLLPNWIAGPAGLGSFLLIYLLRVPAEERLMLDHFGDAYRAYRARTGTILPRPRRWPATARRAALTPATDRRHRRPRGPAPSRVVEDVARGGSGRGGHRPSPVCAWRTAAGLR